MSPFGSIENERESEENLKYILGPDLIFLTQIPKINTRLLCHKIIQYCKYLESINFIREKIKISHNPIVQGKPLNFLNFLVFRKTRL